MRDRNQIQKLAAEDLEHRLDSLETGLRELRIAEAERRGDDAPRDDETRVVGHNNPDTDECACTKCSRFTSGWVPMHEHEISWRDGIRCTMCGRRLLEGPPAPSFESAWEKRRARDAARALKRFAAEAATSRHGDENTSGG